MPRRPTSDDAVRAARFFLESFIRRTDSQDHILPKNDEFSPFSGFCRVFPQFAKKKDGGSATDGVSRAAFNKICLEYFDEGMRKPARNGNPGALESNLAQQRRHFLRGRWLDPADGEDMEILNSLLSEMSAEQSAAATDLLVDFSRWKPGPAGRGGERVCRKRSASPEDSYEDESEEEVPQAGSKRRAMVSEGGQTQTHTHKRISASGVKREAVGGVSASGRGTMLELLCMVASSVEEKSTVSSVGSESDDAASERSTSARHVQPESSGFTELRSPEGVQFGDAQRYVAEERRAHGPRSMCAAMCASSAAASADLSAAAPAPQVAQPVRAEVPAPFANLFKPDAAAHTVVDEGMVRYPVPGCAS